MHEGDPKSWRFSSSLDHIEIFFGAIQTMAICRWPTIWSLEQPPYTTILEYWELDRLEDRENVLQVDSFGDILCLYSGTVVDSIYIYTYM